MKGILDRLKQRGAGRRQQKAAVPPILPNFLFSLVPFLEPVLSSVHVRFKYRAHRSVCWIHSYCMNRCSVLQFKSGQLLSSVNGATVTWRQTTSLSIPLCALCHSISVPIVLVHFLVVIQHLQQQKKFPRFSNSSHLSSNNVTTQFTLFLSFPSFSLSVQQSIQRELSSFVLCSHLSVICIRILINIFKKEVKLKTSSFSFSNTLNTCHGQTTFYTTYFHQFQSSPSSSEENISTIIRLKTYTRIQSKYSLHAVLFKS